MATFEDLGLIKPLLDALCARGFETPTPIQAEIIPHLLEAGGDVTGLAQTGTGKTAAFGLPVLQGIDVSQKITQALVLAPTRELCQQVARELADYSRFITGMRIATVYGGAAFGPQIRDLRAGAQLIVATPGRLKDLLDKGVADLSKLQYLVLDEADQMLDMGFKDELDSILETASVERRTLLFSATMPREVALIAKRYMSDPKEIVAGERNKGTSNVEHLCYRVHASEKYATLRRLLDASGKFYGIVFCRTRESVKSVAGKLASDGYAADALHGELSQVQRESVMGRFRHGNPSILVATDVAARGLDVDNLSHVVHYDLPDEAAVYNHRSGRTGRAGRSGTSMALVHLREGHKIRRIERVLGRRIETARIPAGQEICGLRLNSIVEQVLNVEVNEEALAPYLDKILPQFEELERDELLKKFLAAQFNPILNEYQDAGDLNPPPPPKRSRRDAEALGERRDNRSRGMVGLRVNVGRRQSILPPQLIGLVNQATRSRGIRLGRIDISTDWTDFQVEAASAERVEQALRGMEYRGVQIRVDKRRDGRENRGKRDFREHGDSRGRYDKRNSKGHHRRHTSRYQNTRND